MNFFLLTDGSFKLIIFLTDNPLECNCKLQPFILRVIKSIRRDVGVCIQSDADKNHHKSANCPDLCSCECTENGGIYYMFVDCSSRNLSAFPNFLGLTEVSR